MRPAAPTAPAEHTHGANNHGANNHSDAPAKRAEVLSPPPAMNAHERMRIRTAAFHAAQTYPGPIGELISRELLAWEEFGYRLGATGPIMRLVDTIMDNTGQNTPEVA
jgi:hypothetical protein